MRVEPLVFVTMPISEDFAEVRTAVREAFENEGWRVEALEDMTRKSASLASYVYDMIEQADLVVADLSNSNPNTMYELGIAHGLRKQTVVLLRTGSSEDVPFDVSSYQMLTYNHVRELTHQLHRVAAYAAKRWSDES